MFRSTKIIACFSSSFTKEDADNLYQSCLEKGDYTDLYEEVKSFKHNETDTNAEFLWRKARAYRLYAANHVQDQSKKKKLIHDAYNYSSMAVSSDSNNWAGHKWLAILIGEKAEFEGSKAQLLASPDMKKHFELASKLNPTDATTLHLLGLWHFEFANMSWVTRKVAATIFAKVPESSYEIALSYFEQAEKIDPNFYSMNWLFLARCYKALGDKENLDKYKEKLENFKPNDADDQKAKTDAQKFL